MKWREILSAVAALAMSLTAGLGCRTEDGGPTAMGRASRAPNEGMRGISLQNIRVGDTRWVLHADSASVFKEKKHIEAENVEIEFFENDERVSTLTADRGILLQVSDDLEARGNVQVRSKDGALLKTTVLFWDHQRARIHTHEFVEITGDGDVLMGVGLEADPGLDRVEIQEEVRGEIWSEPGELLGEEEGGS